jgi:predicted ABC-type ATPase
VATRVSSGGHDVPEADILCRYQRSMDNQPRAAELVDLLSVHDNSKREMQRVVLVKNHQLLRLNATGSSWWENALAPYFVTHGIKR